MRPPACRTARSPATPSSPMPVRITASGRRAEGAGRRLEQERARRAGTRRRAARWTARPRPERVRPGAGRPGRGRRCAAPAGRRARPPSPAGRTPSSASRQAAGEAGVMCWTTRMGAAKSPGRPDSRRLQRRRPAGRGGDGHDPRPHVAHRRRQRHGRRAWSRRPGRSEPPVAHHLDLAIALTVATSFWAASSKPGAPGAGRLASTATAPAPRACMAASTSPASVLPVTITIGVGAVIMISLVAA